MLSTLVIRNILLIEDLSLTFPGGFGVFTGETGAGKSILFESLNFCLGDRPKPHFVRHGAEKAQTIAIFDLPVTHSLYSTLRDMDMELDPGENIIIRRTLTCQGKSQAFLNDYPIGIRLLNSLKPQLITIHGQFDPLLEPENYRAVVNTFGGLQDDQTHVAQAHKTWRSFQKKRLGLQDTIRQQEARKAELQEALESIRSLNPKPQEEDEINDLRNKSKHKEKLLHSFQIATSCLEGDNRAEELLSQALSAVHRVTDYLPDDNKNLVEALEKSLVLCQEAAQGLQAELEHLAGESTSLEALEDRLYQLRRLSHRFQVPINNLHGLLETFEAELNTLDGDPFDEKTLRQEEAKAREEFTQRALDLYDKQSLAADNLQSDVQAFFPQLKLENAELKITFEPLEEKEWSELGMYGLRFQIRTNKGTAFGDIHNVVSGGERSRLMLALRVVLSQFLETNCLIFDEIDAGTSGAVASAIGRCLHDLGKTTQVLSITHSPQVAACASAHYLVKKTSQDDTTTTHVMDLKTQAQRTQELAHMLAGEDVTPEALAAAEKLRKS